MMCHIVSLDIRLYYNGADSPERRDSIFISTCIIIQVLVSQLLKMKYILS